MIQIDDPWLGLLVDPDYREKEGITDVDHEIELTVHSMNRAVEGLESVPLSVHFCHAHFNRQHGTRGPYDLIINALGEMNVERFAMELATPDAGGRVLKDFPGTRRWGFFCVIDHTDPHMRTPEEVAPARWRRWNTFRRDSHSTPTVASSPLPAPPTPMDFDESLSSAQRPQRGANLGVGEKDGELTITCDYRGDPMVSGFVSRRSRVVNMTARHRIREYDNGRKTSSTAPGRDIDVR